MEIKSNKNKYGLIMADEFQKTMNMGYKQVYLTVTISSAAALVILAFYRKKTDAR